MVLVAGLFGDLFTSGESINLVLSVNCLAPSVELFEVSVDTEVPDRAIDVVVDTGLPDLAIEVAVVGGLLAM